MADIFIKAVEGDQGAAERLAKALEAFGFSVWHAQTGLPDGVACDLIDQCASAVFVWSPRAAAFSALSATAFHAMASSKYLPVTVDAVDLPTGHDQPAPEDLTDWSGVADHRGFQRLLTAISRKTGKSAIRGAAPALSPAQKAEIAAFMTAAVEGGPLAWDVFLGDHPGSGLRELAFRLKSAPSTHGGFTASPVSAGSPAPVMARFADVTPAPAPAPAPSDHAFDPDAHVPANKAFRIPAGPIIAFMVAVAVPIGGLLAWQAGLFDQSPDARAWRDARNAGSVAALEDYIAENPGGGYVGQARTQIDDLTENARWDTALARDTIAGYEDFLRETESDAHTAAARSRLDSLREDRAWRYAQSQDTLKAYSDYLVAFPDGDHLLNAETRLAELGGAPGSGPVAAARSAPAPQLNTGPFGLDLLAPAVRRAVVSARDAEAAALGKAADARRAADLARNAASRARAGQSGYHVQDSATAHYETAIADNNRNGPGMVRYKSDQFAGDEYHGEWKDGLFSGLGVYQWASADANGSQPPRYEGQWREDQPNGLGVFRYSDESLHMGYELKGLKHGFGVYQYADGGRFEGEFVNDFSTGLGVEWAPDGSIVKAGRWSDGAFVTAIER